MVVTEAPTLFRPTGIEAIGSVPWGTHFCVFYESRADLLDVLLPYFAAGLEHDELCMWVTSEPLTTPDAERELRRAVPDLDRHTARGAIEILDHTQWYVIDGRFDQGRVLDGWVRKHDAAREAGFQGLRLSGNTFWLEDAQWDDFTAYERAVTDVIGRYRMVAMCTYSLARCNALEVVDVVQAHRFALMKREGSWVLIENTDAKRSAEAVRRLNQTLEQQRVELERANRELRAANHELESFSYSVSHDLRAPLRAIEGYSQILLEDHGHDLPPGAVDLVHKVTSSSDRMGRLIGDLLALSRVGRTSTTPGPVDMTGTVRSVVEELRAAEPARAVAVALGDLPEAVGDPVLLRQVWANLLSNAWKFTAGRSEAHVDVESWRDGGDVVYCVRDDGVGFDMAYADKLFGVFQRLHGAEFPGTGIGLAIVQRIVRRHGGRVWGEGTPGGGARFCFALPAGPPAEPRATP